ncbi:winged helix-turn-helix transcriptional regulator [Demequina sediminis]|uniref:winged helix-turn-helix transcriptional regulator n=1 Tax=Demequina sediminis TaxID=1930058 RepID=UPI00330624E6
MSSAAPRLEPPAGHGSEPGPSPELVTSVFAAACTSRAVFEDVTSKWASLVLLALGESPHRFGELRRRVEGEREDALPDAAVPRA